MTGTSNISCPTATLTTSISCSMLTPVEVVVQGLLNPPPKQLEIKVAGEKGRGLFATSNIRRNSFICEYKVPRSRPPFPRNQRPAVEQEYKENGEGCYILEAQDSEGRWWCFDATRRVNQFGRYMNIAPGNMANATPVPPVVVEGRLHWQLQRQNLSRLGMRLPGTRAHKNGRLE